MLSDIEIADYQSIKKASIRLGGFTVVTGPTGSGKSAVIRAMRTCCFNTRGKAFVRHGAKTATVVIGGRDEGFAVGIDRGAENRYRVVAPSGQPDDPLQVDTYTKLGGGVPEQVTDLLRMTQLNFAGQIDPPFLLTSSGSEVARTLGELTNVTLIFEAAREANRRRLAVAAELKRAEASLADLAVRAAQYRGLRQQREALTLAEQSYAVVAELRQKVSLLRFLILEAAKAKEALAVAASNLEAAETPSLEGIDKAAAAVARLRQLRGELAAAVSAQDRQAKAAAAGAEAQESAHRELHEALVDAGRCPTCGQQVSVLGQLGVRLFGDSASRD